VIVVDASLAVKWFVPESDSLVALRFLARNRGELVSPDLLFVEVAGVLVRSANQRAASKDAASRTLDKLMSAETQRHIRAERMTPELVARAARIAIELGHPLKDCVYLALAIELDCLLATCDVHFRNKAATSHPRVRLLADLVEGSPPPG
jgi:predicted nucleic acid-binding protein